MSHKAGNEMDLSTVSVNGSRETDPPIIRPSAIDLPVTEPSAKQTTANDDPITGETPASIRDDVTTALTSPDGELTPGIHVDSTEGVEIYNSFSTESEQEENDILLDASLLSLEVSTSELDKFDVSSQCSMDAPSNELDTENPELVSESRLHCALCKNLFTLPTLLRCCHTFCLDCLVKIVKKKYYFISCPMCSLRTTIPKGGLCKLPTNVVVARLLPTNEESPAVKSCEICSLHGLQHESWGKCLDCGDTMCKDCSDKHTFTRQTAKHKIVSFDQICNDPSLVAQSKANSISCDDHPDRNAVSFCNTCMASLCEHCAVTNHSTHNTKQINHIEAENNATLQKWATSVQDAYDTYLLDDNASEAEYIIDEKEKEVLKDLIDSKKCVLSAVEKKFDLYMNEIKKEFALKRRKYISDRSRHIKQRQKNAQDFIDIVKFLQSEGKADEIAKLTSLITARGHELKQHISNVFPKLTSDHKHWPNVIFNKKDIKTIDMLNFVSINYKKEKHEVQKVAKKSPEANMLLESGDIKMKTGSSRSPIPPLMDVQVPSNKRFVQLKKQYDAGGGSLLGEYPGQIVSGVDVVCNQHDAAFQGPCHSVLQHTQSWNNLAQHRNPGQHGDGYHLIQHSADRQTQCSKLMTEAEDTRIVNITPSLENIHLKLMSHVSVRVNVDTKIPDIVDLCFLMNGNIALVDSRNLRLKAFSTAGKYLNSITDPAPSTITSCADHIIWLSQYSTIQLYDVCAERVVGTKQLGVKCSRALTSFNNNKYLISSGKRIEACRLDGSTAHIIIPHDRDGNMLRDISHIATRSLDQVVVIDSVQKKVIVNNFDGQFIGEFYKKGFIPGGACITEHNFIFVTDKNRNKLVLLSETGVFLKEFIIGVNAPSCIACNGKGVLVVNGADATISIYKYLC